VIISTFLLLNVVIAIVLKHFEEEFEGGEALQTGQLPVTVMDLRTVGEHWAKVTDSDFVNRKQLIALFRAIPDHIMEDLCLHYYVKSNSTEEEIMKFFRELDCPIYLHNDSVHYVDLMHQISMRACQYKLGLNVAKALPIEQVQFLQAEAQHKFKDLSEDIKVCLVLYSLRSLLILCYSYAFIDRFFSFSFFSFLSSQERHGDGKFYFADETLPVIEKSKPSEHNRRESNAFVFPVSKAQQEKKALDDFAKMIEMEQKKNNGK
jgi:hypothetical protein